MLTGLSLPLTGVAAGLASSLKGESRNAWGLSVKEPITAVNILIDVAFLVIPLGVLWRFWRYFRPSKSES